MTNLNTPLTETSIPSITACVPIVSITACVPIVAAAMKTMSAARTWAEQYGPELINTPVETTALAYAVVNPSTPRSRQSLNARLSMWLYAIDDYFDSSAHRLMSIEDMIVRCLQIVRTGHRDDSHVLLTALSDLQFELQEQALYPDLHTLWVERFESGLLGMRFDLETGHLTDSEKARIGVATYLDHADSVLMWLVLIALWITCDDRRILHHLELFKSAAAETSVLVRLANDLATIDRERRESHGNNILMYGATREWVEAEIDRKMAYIRRILAPLNAASFPPAVEIIRFAEWNMILYAHIDSRATDTTIAQAG